MGKGTGLNARETSLFHEEKFAFLTWGSGVMKTFLEVNPEIVKKQGFGRRRGRNLKPHFCKILWKINIFFINFVGYPDP